jgi:hypothetical protein
MLALLSSAHCVGMCGGFAAAIGASKLRAGPSLIRQIVYSAGRVFTYSFLGALGGYAGLYLSRYDTALVRTQQVFSLLAGVMMVLIGAWTLGLFRLRVFRSGAFASLLAPLLGHFLHSRGRSGYFLAGLANGFLPCGLVYAFLATAVATGDVVRGMLVMAVFGAGTVPAMVITGCGSSLLSHSVRTHVYRLAAVFILLAGVMTIKRGIPSGQPCDCHGQTVAPLQHADDAASP